MTKKNVTKIMIQLLHSETNIFTKENSYRNVGCNYYNTSFCLRFSPILLFFKKSLSWKRRNAKQHHMLVVNLFDDFWLFFSQNFTSETQYKCQTSTFMLTQSDTRHEVKSEHAFHPRHTQNASLYRLCCRMQKVYSHTRCFQFNGSECKAIRPYGR